MEAVRVIRVDFVRLAHSPWNDLEEAAACGVVGAETHEEIARIADQLGEKSKTIRHREKARAYESR